ncbi:3398_t:CDS:2, partial [Gigaspora margarita]
NIEVLEEIKNMSHVAIQQEQAIQREQRMKKAKKVHSETTDLVSGYQKQNLEKDPILEPKAKTDKEATTGTVRIKCVRHRRPSSENTHLISKMLIDEPGPSTVGNNSRDTKQIDKEKA